jgi:hypothetical protein
VPAYARGHSRLRLLADPAAAGGGYDDPIGPSPRDCAYRCGRRTLCLRSSSRSSSFWNPAGGPQPGGGPAARRPDGLGYLLLAAGGLILLLRRRWPVAVFLATTAIGLVY